MLKVTANYKCSFILSKMIWKNQRVFQISKLTRTLFGIMYASQVDQNKRFSMLEESLYPKG